MKRRKRISIQKLFSFISLIFILTCCFWFGGRTVYYYLETHKKEKDTEISLTKTLLTGNKNIKKIDNNYYYYQDADNNYITYSNLLFRIIKITNDNKIVMITEEPITNLAFGVDTTYDNSPILKWLNKDDNTESGILEKNLNSPDKHIDKTTSCVDDIDDIKKLTCDNNTSNTISLLTISDYINTGATKSFINNGYITYLANTNSQKEKWIINEDGKLSTDDGSGIYGVKAVITLKSSNTISKGNGTKDNPYEIQSEKSYFGSYVKLDNDIWRVYEETDKILKLSLNDYLKDNNELAKHIYSNNNSFHNDTIYGSLAYYLNNTYLNALSYKDIIITNNYTNGFYNEDNDYDYKTSIEKLADTKVANLGIGDIILNYSLTNYFLATGLYNRSDYIYLMDKNSNVSTIKVSKEANIVPCISINKDKINTGSGNKNDPYRTE